MPRSPAAREAAGSERQGDANRMELDFLSGRGRGTKSDPCCELTKPPWEKGGDRGAPFQRPHGGYLAEAIRECSSLCSLQGNTSRHNINLVRYANGWFWCSVPRDRCPFISWMSRHVPLHFTCGRQNQAAGRERVFQKVSHWHLVPRSVQR